MVVNFEMCVNVDDTSICDSRHTVFLLVAFLVYYLNTCHWALFAWVSEM